jgi:SCY1-like protein 2
MAAVSVIPIVLDYFEDEIVRAEILPKTRTVYEQNGSDVKIVLAVLACVSKILDKLDRSAIIDEVLPLLFEVKLQDVNVLVRVLGKKLHYIQKEENSTLELQFKLRQWYNGN